MNRKIFICSLIFIAYAASGYAQSEIVKTLALSDPGRNHIVRSLDDMEYISYIETSGQQLFVRSDIKLPGYEFVQDMPPNHHVLDFEVCKNIVFFCGYESVNYHGIVGYFNIDSMCNTSSNIYVYDNFIIYPATPSQTATTWPLYFNDLEIVDRQSISGLDYTYIALVGLANNSNTFIMEIIGSCDDPNSWHYVVGHNPEDLDREFEHVSVTDQYVVTGGAVQKMYYGLSLRVFKRYAAPDIFSSGSLSDNIYLYVTNGAAPGTAKAYPYSHSTVYPNEYYDMTAIQGSDRVAVTAFWHYAANPPSGVCDGLLLNVYDIGQTINTTNANCWLTLYDSTQRNMGVSHISDLREDHNGNNMLILLTTDSPTLGVESTCAVVPYTSGTPMPYYYYYLPNTEFNRVVMFDNNTACLWSGYDLTLNNIVYYYRHPTPTSNGCCSSGMHDATDLEEFSAKEEHHELTIHSDQFIFNTYPINCGTETSIIPCMY